MLLMKAIKELLLFLTQKNVHLRRPNLCLGLDKASKQSIQAISQEMTSWGMARTSVARTLSKTVVDMPMFQWLPPF